MKGSTLTSILYTMAFSLGTSLASSSSLEKRNKDDVSWFDEPGLARRVLQCDKNFYTKSVTYATVNHALTSGKGKGRKRWCQSAKCITFPAPFINKQTLFRVEGPYEIFPVKSDSTLYMGGNPGSNFVVYNKRFVVAGVIKKGPLGYSKCLYNDQISSPGTPFMTHMRTKLNEFTRFPFARKNQQDTTTTEPATSRYSRLNPFARKNQQDTTTTEPATSRFSRLNPFAKKNQQQDRAGQQPQESQPNSASPPPYEAEASTSQ